MAVDLFGSIERRPRIVRMHAVDHGHAPGMLPGWKTPNGGHFKCQCGHDAGWLFNLSDTEVRRGLPCPKCNEAKE